MNLDKTLGFGYHMFGNFFIVKINCKLTESQEDDLRQAYPQASIYNNGKYGTRINHVIHGAELHQFQKKLANMLIDKKILDLIDKKNAVNYLDNVNVY
jgi:hypothetical protein